MTKSPSFPPAPSCSSCRGAGSDKEEIAFKAPGDYFGDDMFLKGIMTSCRTYVAMNEVTLCVVSSELFESAEFFGPVKSWIINDIHMRDSEHTVSSMRRKRSFVKFHASGRSETLSQKSLSGMPPGILVSNVKRSVSTVDTDENENVSNDSDVDPGAPEFNEVDNVECYKRVPSLSWLFSLRCGLL